MYLVLLRLLNYLFHKTIKPHDEEHIQIPYHFIQDLCKTRFQLILPFRSKNLKISKCNRVVEKVLNWRCTKC